MNKIRVIDLLNKIANGEEVPDRISFCSYDYKWDKDFDDYLRIEDKQQMAFSFIENHNDNLECFLNDTVDIIEEDKKIEKVNTYVLCDYDFKNKNEDNNLIATNIIDKAFEEYSHKINEIIDKINKE